MNSTQIAELFAGLMDALGYKRFLVHASDMGAGVAEQLRRRQPERLHGVHYSNVYWGYPKPDDPSHEEEKYLESVQGWQFAEGAYAMVQGTKPQTLAYGLNDSRPASPPGWSRSFRAGATAMPRRSSGSTACAPTLPFTG